MNDPLFHMISDGPRPVAPFSHAVETNGFVFVTGQMPTDPKAPDAPLPAGIEAQTKRVVENLKIVLAGIDLDLSHIIMARIYLTEFYRDYEEMNEVWQSYFPVDRRPARTTIGVTGLALHALVEIDLVAKRTEK
ncbi:MAG: RidA family protein [Devosiaceae bacterium]|nr:RidA family protein [Devosiaceae bacterium]